MISLEKLKILTSLQKLPKNVGALGKLIVAKGFKNLPNLVTLMSVKKIPEDYLKYFRKSKYLTSQWLGILCLKSGFNVPFFTFVFSFSVNSKESKDFEHLYLIIKLFLQK